MDNKNDVLKLVIQVFLPGFSEKTSASYSSKLWILCFVRVFGRSGRICALCELDSGHVVSKVSPRPSSKCIQVKTIYRPSCVDVWLILRRSGQFWTVWLDFQPRDCATLRPRGAELCTKKSFIRKDKFCKVMQVARNVKMVAWNVKVVAWNVKLVARNASGKCPKPAKFLRFGQI